MTFGGALQICRERVQDDRRLKDRSNIILETDLVATVIRPAADHYLEGHAGHFVFIK